MFVLPFGGLGVASDERVAERLYEGKSMRWLTRVHLASMPMALQ